MSFIRLDLSTRTAVVTLSHPVGNRINFEMRGELLDAFEQVAASDARVLVIRGEGDDFCLGGDVRDWPGVPAETLRPRVEVFARALDRLEQLDIPTIAAVQGNCMGGGFELALSCDMILASRSAQFAFPEARLGIMTLQGGMLQLAERIGRSKAIELVFLSEPIAAEQMALWNVVNRVVEDGELDQETNLLTERLAAGPPRAYAATKAIMRKWSLDGVKSAKAALYDASMPLFDTDDVQRALVSATEAVNAGKPFPKMTFTGQ